LSKISFNIKNTPEQCQSQIFFHGVKGDKWDNDMINMILRQGMDRLTGTKNIITFDMQLPYGC
jgi:hypothetical protein